MSATKLDAGELICISFQLNYEWYFIITDSYFMSVKCESSVLKFNTLVRITSVI